MRAVKWMVDISVRTRREYLWTLGVHKWVHRVHKMAGVTGLEPAASGVTGRRSNQLSYTPFMLHILL